MRMPNTTYTLEQILSDIQGRMAGRSVRNFAAQLGVSASYLSDVLNGKATPGNKLLHPLGYHVDKTMVWKFVYRKLANGDKRAPSGRNRNV